MVGAHKNLNCSRDLTTPLSGMVCHRGLGIVTINSSTKFDFSICTHYVDMTCIQNITNWASWGS